MPKLKTTAQFIQDARKIHGDKYSYKLVKYKGTHRPIKIICPDHGVFEQAPRTHLDGKGCIKCGNKAKTFTLNRFIERSKKYHGDKYDYSQVEYVNAATKVKVICPDHGDFLSKPDGHMRGRGCPKCAHDKLRGSRTGFVDDAIKKHGDLYDYSLVEYVSFSHKVKIICANHGIFEQTPRTHLHGSGCPQCFGTKRKSLEQFISEAQSVHRDKYNYSETNYTNTDVKIKIICPKHGEFWQTPYQHIKRGNGCPRCSENGLNYAKKTYLYWLRFEKPIASFWKIGITNHPIDKRFSDHRYITCRHIWQFDDGWQAESVERTILTTFSGYSIPPNPKLTKTGYTECFEESVPVELVLMLVESLSKRIKAN
jgi:hypothetical protein